MPHSSRKDLIQPQSRSRIQVRRIDLSWVAVQADLDEHLAVLSHIEAHAVAWLNSSTKMGRDVVGRVTLVRECVCAMRDAVVAL